MFLKLALSLIPGVLGFEDIERILISKAQNHRDAEPIVVDVAMSSGCPYTQDFIPRHLIPFMKTDIPQKIEIWPTFDLEKDVDANGTVCGHADQNDVHSKQSCLGNIALACIWHSTNLNVPFDVRTDWLSQHMDRFQQAPFNDDKNNPNLYAAIINDVADLQLEAVNTCIHDEGADLARAMQKRFQLIGKESKEQYGKLVGTEDPNMLGLFPWVLIDNQYILIERGVLCVAGFPTFIELACLTSPNSKECASNSELYSLPTVYLTKSDFLTTMACIGTGMIVFFLIVTFSLHYFKQRYRRTGIVDAADVRLMDSDEESILSMDATE